MWINSAGQMYEGDCVVGDRFSTDGEVAAWEAAKQKPTLPAVSPRQIRQALTRAGLRAAVETAVATADQDTKDWWEFSSSFDRDNRVVLSVASALGVTVEQLNNLWLLATSL